MYKGVTLGHYFCITYFKSPNYFEPIPYHPLTSSLSISVLATFFIYILCLLCQLFHPWEVSYPALYSPDFHDWLLYVAKQPIILILLPYHINALIFFDISYAFIVDDLIFYPTEDMGFKADRNSSRRRKNNGVKMIIRSKEDTWAYPCTTGKTEHRKHVQLKLWRKIPWTIREDSCFSLYKMMNWISEKWLRTGLV